MMKELVQVVIVDTFCSEKVDEKETEKIIENQVKEKITTFNETSAHKLIDLVNQFALKVEEFQKIEFENLEKVNVNQKEFEKDLEENDNQFNLNFEKLQKQIERMKN